MAITLIRYTCPVCGGILDPLGENSFKCHHCGSVWEKERVDDYGKILELVDEALRKQRQEDISRLVRRRYEEVTKEYVSNIELSRVCNEILDLNPDDFYSQFFLATCKEDYSLADFLYDLDVAKYYSAIDYMLDYLITALQARWITPVSSLIEKAYKGRDLEKYNRYRTKFDNMADSVEEGIFEPSIPRDIFIAYSSADMAKVNELLRILEDENGLSCFVAARNLRHGSGAVENYQQAIYTALDNCKAVVFVSSQNSRSLKCDAKKELDYIKKYLPKMWRIEFLIKDYRGVPVEKVFKEFFANLEYCTAPEQVAERYIDKLNEDIADDIGVPQKSTISSTINIEEEIQRQVQAMLAKQQAEAEAEAKRKAEAEASEKRKADAEAKHKAEVKRKAEADDETEAKRKADAEAKPKANTQTSTSLSDFRIENGVLKKYIGKAQNVIIPSSITALGERAFELCADVKSIIIPDSVKSIGYSAFYACKSLTSIDIPSSVTSIDKDAFWNCGSITSINILGNITSIRDNTFRGCSSLTDINIPDGVTSIGENAFSGCKNLTHINIPSSVTGMGKWAFYDCTLLKNIYCRVASKPSGWHKDWKFGCKANVVWGYKG